MGRKDQKAIAKRLAQRRSRERVRSVGDPQLNARAFPDVPLPASPLSSPSSSLTASLAATSHAAVVVSPSS
jgi:hypothetical protein